jgi:glycine dehydrogenase subunit 1
MNEFYDSYIGSSVEERNSMLEEMGKSDIMDLFSDIPESLILDSAIDIPGPYSEAELTRLFASIARKNHDDVSVISFLGGGVRQQYVPAAIEELMRRGELYTAYTPYQPEISQGILQLTYEYQSMVAELLQMDIVNASLYDWGSALGEVLLIMRRVIKKKKIFIAEPVSRDRFEVAKSYIAHSDVDIEVISAKNGLVDEEKLFEIFRAEAEKPRIERVIGGLYFEVPSFYGTLASNPSKLCDIVHETDALITVGTDPISLGILTPPGEYGADFAVGEGQLLGNGINSGGPLLGILAMKYNRKWIREVPGRLIGSTKELTSDDIGYCITLQTREQHIRREKATSNVCTNQAITAVNAAIYLAALGKRGIIELSQSLYDKAHYLASELDKIDGVRAPAFGPFFSEFVVHLGETPHSRLETLCMDRGFVPGHKILAKATLRLISVNELHTKTDLDNFVQAIKEVVS